MTTTLHIEMLAHTKSHKMLDNFICCDKFFKRLTDCKLVTTGARSDHSPIQENFKITAIKLNIPKEDTIVIDWETIRTDKYYGEILMIGYTYN